MPTAGKRARRIPIFLAVLPVLASAFAFSGSAPRGLASVHEEPAATAILPAPFRSGETLRYQVSWGSFSDAATLVLRVLPSRSASPASIWRFEAVARTLGGMHKLYPMDDQLESESATKNLASREFDLHRHEPGWQENHVLRLESRGESLQTAPPHVLVPPGTHDPLGVLYALRSTDWQETDDWSSTVFDGNAIYFLRARRDSASEPLAVPAGHFETTRISIRLFQYNREVPGKIFTVWLAHDSAHTPVQMEADLPMKTLLAKLTAAGN